MLLRFCFIFHTIIAIIAVTALTLAIVALPKNKTEQSTLSTTTYIDGDLPSVDDTNPIVVSYHPFAGIAEQKTWSIVSAGFGSAMSENKTIDYSQAWTVDAQTKTAPHRGSLLVARVEGSGIEVSTIEIRATKTKDSTYTMNVPGVSVSRIHEIVPLESDNYFLIFGATDGAVYGVYFNVGFFFAATFSNQVKIATNGYNTTAIRTTRGVDYIGKTTIVAVQERDSTTIYGCTTTGCGMISSNHKSKIDLLYAIESGNKITLYYYDVFVHSISFTSSFTNVIASVIPQSVFINQGQIARSLESPSFVSYIAIENRLTACATRFRLSPQLQIPSCYNTLIASDLSNTPNVQVVVAGSQIYFGYQNTKREYVMKVVGVVGDYATQIVLDTSSEPVSLSQYVTTPILANTLKNGVALLFPATATQPSRMISFVAPGGLSPVGIT